MLLVQLDQHQNTDSVLVTELSHSLGSRSYQQKHPRCRSATAILKMAKFQSPIMVFLAHLILLLGVPVTLVGAVPVTPNHKSLAVSRQQAASSYWVANIKRQGTVPFGGSSNYEVFRNVQDFGATGQWKVQYRSVLVQTNSLQVTVQLTTPLPSTRPFPPVTAVARAVILRPQPQLSYTSHPALTWCPSQSSNTTILKWSVMQLICL